MSPPAACPTSAARSFWSIRSTAPRNSSRAATISPSISGWSAMACRSSASSSRRRPARSMSASSARAPGAREVDERHRSAERRPIHVRPRRERPDRRRREQVASHAGDRRLHRPLRGRRAGLGRLVAQILRRRRRRGRPLSAHGHDHAVGHRGRRRDPPRRRRHGGHARWRAAALRAERRRRASRPSRIRGSSPPVALQHPAELDACRQRCSAKPVPRRIADAPGESCRATLGSNNRRNRANSRPGRPCQNGAFPCLSAARRCG